MPHRLLPPSSPVEFYHDGELILAERGEPLAQAILAADRWTIARSPKLHRPRGPYCMRGRCDGCLARVNGIPNQMTCLLRAQGGEQVETQNVVGTRSADLLEAADFLFPNGVDHHRLFAGVRGVSDFVERVARRVSGLGTLPDRTLTRKPAEHRHARVLIVGGGAAGLSAAAALGSSKALIVDEGAAWGGSLRLLDPARANELEREATAGGAELLGGACVVALYRENADPALTALIVGRERTLVVTTETVVLATGRHDPVPLFGSNDLPGIISARAALALLRGGIAVGEKMAVLDGGRFAEGYAQLAPSAKLLKIRAGDVERAVGRDQVSGAYLVQLKGRRRVALDALLVDGPGAPSFELAVQAGASVAFTAEGYVPVRDSNGQVAPGVFCAGSGAGAALSSEIDGRTIAESVARAVA